MSSAVQVGVVVSIPCTDWDGTAGPGTNGQSTSGTTEVRLLSGHGRPGPAGSTSSRQAPAGGPGTRHAHAVSCVQGQGQGPAAERAKPYRTGCRSPADPIRNLTHTILRKCSVPDAPWVSQQASHADGDQPAGDEIGSTGCAIVASGTSARQRD